MIRILITGARGFLGRNLVAHLQERKDCQVMLFDREESLQDLAYRLAQADIIFHLAGINRPQDPSEFESGNVRLTEKICEFLRQARHTPKIIFSSSIQAELQNPYGASKARAEDILHQFGAETGACIRIYRLKNVFGKWCRPNFNSVTATFCHNIANDLPIVISDPVRQVELSYVDDVVAAFLEEIGSREPNSRVTAQLRSYGIALGDLAGRIQAFHEMRSTLILPDFADWFNRALYATYLSYLSAEGRQQQLGIKSDTRGSLAEFIKQAHFGQAFVSRTKPGITRGNHYHHTKTEKFFVVEGEGLIRMRAINDSSVSEYRVTGSEFQIVDIPPGFTHSITNVGEGEMVTLFWASEIFDPNCTDTYYVDVDSGVPNKSMSLEYT